MLETFSHAQATPSPLAGAQISVFVQPYTTSGAPASGWCARLSHADGRCRGGGHCRGRYRIISLQIRTQNLALGCAASRRAATANTTVATAAAAAATAAASTSTATSSGLWLWVTNVTLYVRREFRRLAVVAAAAVVGRIRLKLARLGCCSPWCASSGPSLAASAERDEGWTTVGGKHRVAQVIGREAWGLRPRRGQRIGR